MKPIFEIANVFQGLARSGRGAGVRIGDWRVRLVESGDVPDDGILSLDGLRQIELVRSPRTERHLLRPFDVLVTARSGSVQVALVPPDVSRTVAGITLLVVRPREPELGMGHWLWYFLTSSRGKAQLVRRMTATATLKSLSARNLGEVEVPVPTYRDMDKVAHLVEASEEAYTRSVEAARVRRETVRDAVVERIGYNAAKAPLGGTNAAQKAGVGVEALAGR